MEGLKKFSTWLGLIVSVISLILMMLGYGVAIEAENVFGVPHATLYESIFDLIDLGGRIAILEWFIRSAHAFFCIDIVQLYKQHCVVLKISFLIITTIFGVIYFIDLRKKDTKKYQFKIFDKFRWSISYPKRILIYFWLIANAIVAFIPLILKILIFGIVIILYFIILIPSNGRELASIYFNDYVIYSTQCRFLHFPKEKPPKQSKENKLCEIERNAATCVAVFDDKREIGRGYVALSTSKYLLLYNPLNNKKLRVSTSSTRIENIASISDKNTEVNITKSGKSKPD